MTASPAGMAENWAGAVRQNASIPPTAPTSLVLSDDGYTADSGTGALQSTERSRKGSQVRMALLAGALASDPASTPPPQLSAAGGVTSNPTGSSNGIKVVRCEMSEQAHPDHQKHKVLSDGGDHSFSSAFAFSQGDGTAVPGPTMSQQSSWPSSAYAQAAPPSAYPPGSTSSYGAPPASYGAPAPQAQYSHHAQYQYGSAPSPYQQQQWTLEVTLHPGNQPYAGPPPHTGPPPYAGPPPPELACQAEALQGWLGLRGERLGEEFRTRWFRLYGNTLYYSNEQDGADAKQILLDAMTEVRVLADPMATPEGKVMKMRKPNGFEIYHGKGLRVWYIDAGNPEKLDIWMRGLRAVVAQQRGMHGGSYAGPPSSGAYGPPSGAYGPSSGAYGPPSGAYGPPYR
eukprot:gnl/TRDRNA2_/TRDRNA2_38712_c0_seq1.p1 gnl/TRDRNA2_/TRDRNA2_38712_c0~~gnl/TRDRNA2_/TRDRNA2_38712_c0_seq1.p1  ORF type:complete len:410 (-),score=60.17 gnl/TRDRNA2_/TRDRNA2_38712_c0_seq1:28-1224(-)